MNTSKIASAGKNFTNIGITLIISMLLGVIQYYITTNLNLLNPSDLELWKTTIYGGGVLQLMCWIFIVSSFFNAGSALSSLDEEVVVDSTRTIIERELNEDINKNETRAGEPFEGGIIVYTDEKGEHGLICSKNDLGEGNWEEAKKLCEEYKEGGFSDWKLPNRDELKLMHSLLQKSQKSNFSSKLYWSINQQSDAWGYGTDYAIIQNFTDGSQDSYRKDTNNHIRAVRFF